MKTYRRALIVATLVLIGGISASLAGNLVAINLDNADPGFGEHVSAVLWPLLLFGVVEMLIHTPWVANWRDHLTKLATTIGVGAVAAWVSYWHLANVLSHYGYDVASRYAGPLSMDMGMVMAALALNRVGQARRTSDTSLATVQTVANSDGSLATLATVQTVANPDGTLATVERIDGRPLSKDEAVATYSELSGWTRGLAKARQDQLDTIVHGNVQHGVDMAISQAGQELASETEHWLDRLAGQLDTSTTPPVPVVSGEPAKRAKLTAEQDDELTWLVSAAAESGAYSTGQINELLAGWFGVSTRTIRRRMSALGLAPTSAPPAS